MRYAQYDALAELIDYPGPGLRGRARDLLDFLRENHAHAASDAERFLDALPAGLLDQQELHTRTFDVQSLTTLDVGYVLFGDDYKRGALLSNLNREHTRAQNDCRGELADYLPNLLRLIPKLDDAQLLDELVEQVLVPALMLMVREFDPARVGSKNANYRKHYKTLIDPAHGGDPAVYCSALKAVLRTLERDFRMSGTIAKLQEWSNRPQSVDFLRLVEREMDIERDANPANSGCDA